MQITIGDDARAFIRDLPEKDRRVIGEHIDRLKEHPHASGDIKKLKTRRPRWRMHISSKFTVFYFVVDDVVCVDHIMSQELAHKKYGKI